MEDSIRHLASVQPLYSDMDFDLYRTGSTRREWESNPWLLEMVASSPICRGNHAQHLLNGHLNYRTRTLDTYSL